MGKDESRVVGELGLQGVTLWFMSGGAGGWRGVLTEQEGGGRKDDKRRETNQLRGTSDE